MTGSTVASPISTSGLRAGYGAVAVVSDLNLVVAPGQVVALLGPNGAGKTTALMTLAGILQPLGGESAVLGHKLGHTTTEELVNAGLGYVPDDRALFGELTVQEHLRVSTGSMKPDVSEVMRCFPQLEPLRNRRAGLLSGGEQQMLALGCALIRDPSALLIDELSMGLAPLVVRQLLETVRDLANRRRIAVLLVEQHVYLALDFADYAYVLNHGSIVLEGDAHELAKDTDRLTKSYLDFTDSALTVSGNNEGTHG